MIRLRPMLRCTLLVLLILCAAADARAQSGLGPAPPPPVPAALTPAQAQQVLEVLRDDKKRAQFINVLEGMAGALPAAAGVVPASGPAAAPPHAAAAAPAAPAAAAAPPAAGDLPIPLAPDSLGAEILVGASNRLARLSAEFVDTARVLTDFPLILRWIGHLIHTPEARDQVARAAWRLAVVMAVAVAAERGAIRLLRPVVARLAERVPLAAPPPRRARRNGPSGAVTDGKSRRRPTLALLLRRLPYVVGRLALDLLPLLVLAAVGYTLLGTPLGDRVTARLVILAVLNAYLVTRLVVALTRVLLAPHVPPLRLVPLSDDTAAYLTRWVRRIAIIAIFGYAAAEVGLLFGLYRVAHDGLLKLVAFAVLLCLIVIVLQTRRRVAEVIRARRDATGPMAVLRNRLAGVWHIIAVFYLSALWLVWAFEVENGFARLVQVFVSSIVVAALARVLTVSANGTLERGLRIPPEVAARYPGLEARARRYHPIARGIVDGIILAVAAVVLLQAWGLDSFAWFGHGALGGRLVSALLSIGITLLCALLTWEAANAALQRRLARSAGGAQAARMRTLLPMLRTALLVSISIVAGLIVLSEIGVNIAPLLAGAGVVGIAIGFGSQKLVQDLITGIFLLFENAMQVGDWVTVSGLSGTVEHLSIRTIRLRAGDGSVHIIPFSAVTSVTNVNRGIGNASVSVSVALTEDIDRVCALLAEIATGMREDTRFGASMLSDLQLWGVDKVEAGGVTIVGQIVCTDSGRWNVQREFNRRMQRRFAELGIQLAVPVQRLTVVPAQERPAASEVAPRLVPGEATRAG